MMMINEMILMDLPNKHKDDKRRHTRWLNIVFISLFACVGTLLRITIGALFSICEENPQETEAANTSSSNNMIQYVIPAGVCVTSNDSPLFVDLPANMLGSFVMGMILSGGLLGLPTRAPVACVSVRSWLQELDFIHFGLRVGFCGSLTTFSSWNVNLAIFFVSDTSYAWAQVLFGFVIGIAMAMVSFTVGQHAGILLHRLNNSYLAREADLHVDSPQKYCHHRELPDFERHFLTDVYGEDFLQTLRRKHPNLIEELNSWKLSTSEYRHPYGPFRDTLREVEVAAFVENCGDISSRYGSLVNKVGWNLNSLQSYVSLKHQHAVKSYEAKDESIFILLGVFACIFLILIFAFLLDGAASISTETESSRSLQNYHVLCLSGIFAPFGALGRWFLTRYNRGYLRGKYEWLPLGTLLTNLLGCIGSIIISSLISSYNYDYKSECILKAFQMGFFGALSTVSTFANEISVLSKGFPSNMRGYVYAVGTISLTFTVSCIVYGLSTNSLLP